MTRFIHGQPRVGLRTGRPTPAGFEPTYFIAQSNAMKMQPTIYETALRYLELGYSPIPIVAGQKRAAIKWKQWQDIRPGRREIDKWFSVAEANVGLVTGNGVVVVDIDDPDLLEIVIERCGATPMRCRTPSGGMHLYYAMYAAAFITATPCGSWTSRSICAAKALMPSVRRRETYTAFRTSGPGK